MSEILEFKVFCVVSYKQSHNLSGKEVAEIFKKYGVLNYIDAFFDILHSTGQRYIVEDLDLFIESRK